MCLSPTQQSSRSDLFIQKKTTSATAASPNSHEALLSVTVYNRLAWGRGYLSRASQHVVLASQSLGDLYEAIPCPSNELAEEMIDDNHLTGYRKESKPSRGCLLCIDGLVYGDGQCEIDYAEYVFITLHGPAALTSSHAANFSYKSTRSRPANDRQCKRRPQPSMKLHSHLSP